jgi:hypothetical protein
MAEPGGNSDRDDKTSLDRWYERFFRDGCPMRKRSDGIQRFGEALPSFVTRTSGKVRVIAGSSAARARNARSNRVVSGSHGGKSAAPPRFSARCQSQVCQVLSA